MEIKLLIYTPKIDRTVALNNLVYKSDAFILIKGIYKWFEYSPKDSEGFLEQFTTKPDLFTEEFMICSYQKYLLNLLKLLHSKLDEAIPDKEIYTFNILWNDLCKISIGRSAIDLENLTNDEAIDAFLYKKPTMFKLSLWQLENLVKECIKLLYALETYIELLKQTDRYK